MNTKQKLHQIHLNEWAIRFSEQKSSGLTVKQWCEQNNFSIHTYNYWKHILKEELASQILPDIIPITIPSLGRGWIFTSLQAGRVWPILMAPQFR